MKGFEKKMVETGTNKAGYKVYERKVVPSKEDDIEESEPRKMNRRGFLSLFSGALSSAALAGTPALSLLTKDEERKEESTHSESVSLGHEDVASLIEDNSPQTHERITGTDSKHFNTAIMKYAAVYDRDVLIALERALTPTEGDAEGRSRFDYLQEELVVEGIPRSISAELQKYIVGVCNEESRFKAESESGVGAKGFLQFMPGTWKEHSNKEDDIRSLVDQVEAAKSKFTQIYRHFAHTCKHELNAIKAEYFFNDEYLFDAQFLVPLVVNAYNAGQGTMEKVLKWFVYAYPMQEKTNTIFGGEEVISGYDVFFAMAQTVFMQNAVPNYKDEASAYVPKIYAATRTLENNRSRVESV